VSDATAFTDHKAKKALAERGKSTEETVKTYGEREEKARGMKFHWEKIPDARTAGGRFKPVAGDFRFSYLGRYAIVEVKEVKTSVDRLPGGNFSRDKIARCYRHHLAGAITVVVIHYTRVDKWVVVPVKHFFDNVLPSWNTREFPSFSSAAEALDFGLRELFNS
jgi:hypothetical protein